MKKFILNIIYKVLAYYARILIKKFDPVVIAVTGSAGKTITKEAIYSALESSFGDKVRKSEGNLNAEIGVPLSILGYKKPPHKFIWPIFLMATYFKTRVKKYPQYLVLEMGVEHKGDIEYFCSIAKPTVAVITSLAGAHLANFKNDQEYREEKLSIIENLKTKGLAIVNGDDEKLNQLKGENIKKIGIEMNEADYEAEAINCEIDCTKYRAVSMGHKISVETRQLGRQAIYAQLFAFAVADYFKIQLITLGKVFKNNKPLPGRLNPIEGKKGTTIIDDTYNANPASTKAAIDLLGNIQHTGRKVLVLGNMNELGKEEKNAHCEIADYAKDKVDWAIFVGPNAKDMSLAFGKNRSQYFPHRRELEPQIESLIEENDLILVKASQNNNYFEEIVKKLMKNPANADQLLVRQGREWIRKKQTTRTF